MVNRSNLDIIKISLVVTLASFLGWLNFTALNDLLPDLASLEPILKLMIGIGGIFILVKLNLRKQPI